MTSAQQRKGSTFEREVVAYLADHGHPLAERAYGAGRPDDHGDVDGLPGWVIECKNHRTLDLAGFADEAERERVSAGADFAAVVAKRRSKPVQAAYVVLTLADFARLLTEVDS